MFWSEVKHACRLLWRSPAFALLATLILALSIGANTALFSVVNNVLLSPLPYSQPEEIVAVNTKFRDSGREHRRVTGGDFFDIAAEMRSLEAISYYFGGEMGVQVGEAATFTGAYLVNPGFFQVFAVSPVLGRLFTSDTADEHTAVVSAGFAQRHFGSAREALGKRLSLEAETYEIVGIVAALDFPKDAAVWLPAPLKPTNSNRSAYNYSGVARLREGTPIEAAQAELGQLAGRLAVAYPDENKNKTFILTPLRDQMVGGVRSTLQLLMAAVSLVLLTACANIANLLLARATGRSREMAVRAAIGASRWAIVRQLLAESLVLALAGGAAGCLLAYLLIGALPSIAPANLPRLAEVKVDMTAMLFALIASIAASILFGLVPSLQASRADLNEALRQGGRGTTAGSPRLRSALVVAEVALSIVLAIGAGLLFRSFLALNDVNLGYRTEGMLVMYAHAPAHSDAEYIATSKRFEQLFGELKTIPGVTSAAGVMGLPTGRYGSNGSYAVEGKSEFRPGVKLPNAGFRLASAGYFSTMGVPLLRGRDFDSRDQFDATPVAIISDALAKQSFSGEDPIGKRIMCGLDSPEWMTIVGVVGDVRQDSPASSPAPELYMPLNQHPSRANEIQVVVRTAVAPASVISAVQQKTEAMSNGVATKFTTMDAMIADSMALPRFRTWLIGGFAFLSLALAVAGVYSVMTYTVVQRTSEMGVRMALGASGGDVLWLVLGRAAALTAVGVVIGVAAAIAGSHIVKTMVFGLAPTDVSTYLFVAGLVAAATLAAAAIPAWRATRIDPVSALRQE